MRVGSLFSGVGGFDLGLEWAGMEVVWQVERDEFCRKVLRKHWPDVTQYEDVHDVGKHNLEAVDLICGGFPCQPVSLAGKRKGQDDERWLWPEFARIIRELRPRYALVENVPGLLTRGMGDVLGDLAELRYDAEWGCVSAASVGAPHLRKRIFVVARDARWRDDGEGCGTLRGVSEGSHTIATGVREEVAHTPGSRRPEGLRAPRRSSRDEARGSGPKRLGGEMADTRSAGLEGCGQAGTTRNGDWWATEPDVGRVANGVPARVDRLRALGNAILPQVAEYIGRRIMEAA